MKYLNYFNENHNNILTPKQMVNYIENNELRDSFGIIDDYNEIKDIAYSSDIWKLEYVDLSNFNVVADKKYDNKSINLPPIVKYYDNQYEVLDGKHRIGMFKQMGYNKVLMWVGYE